MNNVISGRLAALESIIESGIQTFIEVGNALLEIRDKRLYREQGFTTFEAYCRKRWSMSQPYAQRTIDAAKVAANLMPIGITPKNEAQTRELARLTPEQQREVAAAVDLTQATAKDVHVAVEQFQQTGLSPHPTKSLAKMINERRQHLTPTLAPPKLSAEERREEESQRRQREASSSRYVRLMEFIEAIETIADAQYAMPEIAAHIVKFDTPDQDWPGQCREAYGRLRNLCEELKLPPSERQAEHEFVHRLFKEFMRRRREVGLVSSKGVWNPDAICKVDLINILDWLEGELQNYLNGNPKL